MRWVTEPTGPRFRTDFYTADNLRCHQRAADRQRRVPDPNYNGDKHGSIPRLALQPIALAALAIGVQRCAGLHLRDRGDVRGNFDSTVTVGLGMRATGPSCNLITDGATGTGAPAGCLAPTSLLGDQGDLNYGKYDLFTGYLKGTHELLLKMPKDVDFLFRFNWVADPISTGTTGITSATSPPPPAVTNGLSDEAYSALQFKARLLDLWVSKSSQVGDQLARVRFGNQVPQLGREPVPARRHQRHQCNGHHAAVAARHPTQGGLDPGADPEHQLRAGPRRSMPRPMCSSRGTRATFRLRASYWSVVNGLGKGHEAYGLAQVNPSNGQQWGVALRYQPSEIPLNLGVYAMAYQDKTPNFSVNINNTGAVGWTFATDRRMYGVSANFPIGDLAVGTELSYRPKDAVALNSATSGCASQNGNCWVDSAKWQWALTGILSLTPNTGGGFLKLLGADTATLLAEAVVHSLPQSRAELCGVTSSRPADGDAGQLTDPNARPGGVRQQDFVGHQLRLQLGLRRHGDPGLAGGAGDLLLPGALGKYAEPVGAVHVGCEFGELHHQLHQEPGHLAVLAELRDVLGRLFVAATSPMATATSSVPCSRATSDPAHLAALRGERPAPPSLPLGGVRHRLSRA